IDVNPAPNGSAHLYRDAAIFESRLNGPEAQPTRLGGAKLVRVVRDGMSADALRIPIAAPAEAEINLVIEDGSNPPLEIPSVALVFAELPWIYFESPGGVIAKYG